MFFMLCFLKFYFPNYFSYLYLAYRRIYKNCWEYLIHYWPHLGQKTTFIRRLPYFDKCSNYFLILLNLKEMKHLRLIFQTESLIDHFNFSILKFKLLKIWHFCFISTSFRIQDQLISK